MRTLAILVSALLLPASSVPAADAEPAKPTKAAETPSATAPAKAADAPAAPAGSAPASSIVMLEIAEVQKGYVEAFNKGDAKLVASYFTSDADWIDDQGTLIRGRAAIQRALEDVMSAHKGRPLKLRLDSVRALAPEVVVGNALSTFNGTDKSGEAAAFIAIYVKQDGKWNITLLTETSEVEDDE